MERNGLRSLRVVGPVSRRDAASFQTMSRVEWVSMAEIVLRVRLTGGQHIDIRYEEPDTDNVDEVIEHVTSTLAKNSGVLRTRHGNRLVALYGRGVAALEVAPRGAVL